MKMNRKEGRSLPKRSILEKLPMMSLGLGAIFLMMLLAGCDRLPGRGNQEAAGEGAPAAEKEGEAETVFAVATTEAVEGQIYNYLDVNGDITAKTTVDTYPDAAGKLNRLYVTVGDTVRKDQIIAEVDPSRPGMNFAASPVKAAISGTVTSTLVEVGAMVSQQAPIVRISKMDDLQIETFVAERFISRMKVGQWALVTLDAFPGQTFSARVTELSPMVDPVSRTLDLKLQFTERVRDIRAGMFAQIKIITQEKKGVVKIPASAVIERFGEDFVFVVKDESTVEKRNIVKGIEIDGKQEIQEGVADGETVVIRGQSLLEEGSKVKIVQRTEPLSVEDTIE
jgi:membrane fusion protein, multidrug efflux system